MTVPQYQSRAFRPPAGDSNSGMAIKIVASVRSHLSADEGQCCMACMRALGWEHGIRELYAKRLKVGEGVRGDKICICRGDHQQHDLCGGVAVHGEKWPEDSGPWLTDET